MSPQLQKYVDRIDAMSLRERALIFAAAAVVMMTLINSALVEPLLARQKVLSQQIVQKQNEIKALQAQIQVFIQPRDPQQGGEKRDRLLQLRRQIAQIDKQLSERQRNMVAPDRIAGLLESVLRKNRQIELVTLRSLPTVGLTADGSPIPAKAGDATQPAAAQELYRHGVELTIRGGYLDLLDYVTNLETMPEKLFWGGAVLSANGPVSTFKLTLFTLSRERKWLAI